MWLVFEALISVYGSARQVEAELAHPIVWNLIRTTVHRQFPGNPAMHLPGRSMRRHHYQYARQQCLNTNGILEALMQRHRELAAQQAVELGLCDPELPLPDGDSHHSKLSTVGDAVPNLLRVIVPARPP